MSETVKFVSFCIFPEQYRLKPKFAEKEHTGCIKCAANNGAVLATGSSDETIRQVIFFVLDFTVIFSKRTESKNV